MKKLQLALTFIILFVVYNLSLAQNKEELIKVTNQLYMISGMGGNVSFLVTDDGVLVVDAGNTPGAIKTIEKHIKSVTDKPIKYLVYTHYHLDHTLGICGYDKNFTIVGQENVFSNLKVFAVPSLEAYSSIELPGEIQKTKREIDSLKRVNNEKWKESQSKYENLLVELEEMKKSKIIFPDITFKDEMNLYLGKDTIALKYPGNTHTSCNILVEFKNQNAIATGDFFFHEILPYIDYDAKCNTKNWIDQIKYISSQNFKYVIPGHGKLAQNKDLLDEAQYLTDLREAIQSYISKNKTLDETLKELKMEKYSSYGYQQILPIEINAVYRELKGR